MSINHHVTILCYLIVNPCDLTMYVLKTFDPVNRMLEAYREVQWSKTLAMRTCLRDFKCFRVFGMDILGLDRWTY